MANYVASGIGSAVRVPKPLPASGTSAPPTPTTGQLWPRGNKS